MKLSHASALASARMREASTAGDETAARFDELQRKLVPLWRSIRSMTPDEQTIVVVPSILRKSKKLDRLKAVGA